MPHDVKVRLADGLASPEPNPLARAECQTCWAESPAVPWDEAVDWAWEHEQGTR